MQPLVVILDLCDPILEVLEYEHYLPDLLLQNRDQLDSSVVLDVVLLDFLLLVDRTDSPHVQEAV